MCLFRTCLDKDGVGLNDDIISGHHKHKEKKRKRENLPNWMNSYLRDDAAHAVVEQKAAGCHVAGIKIDVDKTDVLVA